MNDRNKWFEAWNYQAAGAFPVLIFLNVIRDYSLPIGLNILLSLMAACVGVCFVMIFMCLKEYEAKRIHDEEKDNE